MKIILAIKSGISRSLNSWKGILIFWFISFLTVLLVVVPLKASLKSALDNSMITEKLMKGINIDVLGDLGNNLTSMISSLSAGIFVLFLATFILSTFISGGLFDSLKNGSASFHTENFFRASAKNFWSYLIINSILYLLFLVLFIIILVIPVSLAYNSESAPEGMVFRVLEAGISVFILAMALVYLVADYARAWQASREQNAGLRALGFGFSQTFRTFLSSFPLMLIMLALQGFISWIAIKVISNIIPVKSGGILLLFIISQSIFFLKLFLKVSRYGSVTALMEQNSPGEVSNSVSDFDSYYEPVNPAAAFNPGNDLLI